MNILPTAELRLSEHLLEKPKPNAKLMEVAEQFEAIFEPDAKADARSKIVRWHF